MASIRSLLASTSSTIFSIACPDGVFSRSGKYVKIDDPILKELDIDNAIKDKVPSYERKFVNHACLFILDERICFYDS